jgi:hypothetical protein
MAIHYSQLFTFPSILNPHVLFFLLKARILNITNVDYY